MTSTQGEPSLLSKPWQSRAWVQLLAVVVGVLPLYSSLIIYQLRRDQPFSIQTFIFYLAVIAPLAIVIALLLLRFLCGENPRDLNRRPGKLSSDMLAALILSRGPRRQRCLDLLSFGVPSGVCLQYEVKRSLCGGGQQSRVVGSFVGSIDVLGSRSEEVIRVFLLSRLWKVWPSTMGKSSTWAHFACLFGLIHVYRGPVRVVWAAICGLIMALYYLRFGRVVPLILGALPNALQVAVVAVLSRQGLTGGI